MSSAIDDLFDDIQAAGIHVRIDPPDLIVSPAERLTPELEERLRQHKAEILDRLKLKESMRRLEAANVLIGIPRKAFSGLLKPDTEADKAVAEGFTIYKPA